MTGATVAVGSDGDDDEAVHDFSPLLLVYRSGRLVPPGLDAATGVESRDVPLSTSSFVRLYLPPGASGAGGGGDTDKMKARLPVVVYFHGGGFVMGSAASCVYHRFLNDLAAACPAVAPVAVSVDYRLAPEHPLPAAYEDSLAALEWVLAAADPWLAAHGDPARVFLAGDSAGGNICPHLAMHPDIRQGAGLRGAVLILIHPWFWPSGARSPSAGRESIEARGSAARQEEAPVGVGVPRRGRRRGLLGINTPWMCSGRACGRSCR